MGGNTSAQSAPQAQESSGAKYQKIVNILAFAVYDKVYSPVDRMARAIDKSLVITSLYEVMRYVSTEIRRCYEIKTGSQKPRDEEEARRCRILESLTNFEIPYEEISEFLELLDRRPSIAKKVAMQALALGLKLALRGGNSPKR